MRPSETSTSEVPSVLFLRTFALARASPLVTTSTSSPGSRGRARNSCKAPVGRKRSEVYHKADIMLRWKSLRSLPMVATRMARKKPQSASRASENSIHLSVWLKPTEMSPNSGIDCFVRYCWPCSQVRKSNVAPAATAQTRKQPCHKLNTLFPRRTTARIAQTTNKYSIWHAKVDAGSCCLAIQSLTKSGSREFAWSADNTAMTTASNLLWTRSVCRSARTKGQLFRKLRWPLMCQVFSSSSICAGWSSSSPACPMRTPGHFW
mmetsp:Transcript_89910/g.251368  ORF Transcript_89910/g.251368 Transcript_89910/m.251368 type:complete len:263 (+) Transcript_89910:172-960(+)